MPRGRAPDARRKRRAAVPICCRSPVSSTFAALAAENVPSSTRHSSSSPDTPPMGSSLTVYIAGAGGMSVRSILPFFRGPPPAARTNSCTRLPRRRPAASASATGASFAARSAAWSLPTCCAGPTTPISSGIYVATGCGHRVPNTLASFSTTPSAPTVTRGGIKDTQSRCRGCQPLCFRPSYEPRSCGRSVLRCRARVSPPVCLPRFSIVPCRTNRVRDSLARG
jgi:hypothetical protein